MERRRRGFTLIELLVVVAIIVILAGILFPVFKEGYRKAKIQSCLFNLKQVGVAMQQYAGDYKDKFPYGHNWDTGFDKIWPAYTKDRRVLACPTDRTPNKDGLTLLYRDGVMVEPPTRITYNYRNRFYPFDPRNKDGSYVNPWQPNSPGISQVGLLWDSFTLAHMYGIGVLFGDGHVKLLNHDEFHRSTSRNGWLVLGAMSEWPDGHPYKYRRVWVGDPPNWKELADYEANTNNRVE